MGESCTEPDIVMLSLYPDEDNPLWFLLTSWRCQSAPDEFSRLYRLECCLSCDTSLSFTTDPSTGFNPRDLLLVSFFPWTHTCSCVLILNLISDYDLILGCQFVSLALMFLLYSHQTLKPKMMARIQHTGVIKHKERLPSTIKLLNPVVEYRSVISPSCNAL